MNAQTDFARSSNTATGGHSSSTFPGISSETKKSAEQASSDFQTLRDDLSALKDTVTNLASQAGSDAAKAARTATAGVANQVSDAASSLADKGSELASAASEQVKTFASELENMGRKNPLGTIAAAVVVGVLVGLIGRGRS